MAPGNYARINDLEGLSRLVEQLLEQGRPIGFDVETGYYGPDRDGGSLDIDWCDQFVCGFSITNSPAWARYVPVAHDLADNLPEYEAWEMIKPVLETLPVYCHNFKFEKRNLRALEQKGRGPRIELKLGGDTILQEFVLSLHRFMGLKELVSFHLNHRMTHIEELFDGMTKAGMKRLRFNKLELTPEVINYACEDSAYCLSLRELNEQRALQERTLIYQLEHQIMEMMCDVEEYGMHIEWEEMDAERQRAYPFRDRMEKATKSALGLLADRDLTTMNLGSTMQLRKLLYDDLGMTTTRKTKTGALSTDKEALKALSIEHPAIKKLLELREVDNHIKRFDKWLDENHYAADGRAHPHFAQTTVGSGRFAASDPPVHQMPKDVKFTTHLDLNVNNKEEWSNLVAHGEPYVDYWVENFRDYLSATPGHYLLGFDYSQIELRMMAGLSQEPILLHAFENDIDVHSITAGMMLNKPVDQVDYKLDRPIGKTMNFALLFQMGPQSLAERLAVSRERAEELYNNYFAQFASITTWIEDRKAEGRNRQYVETFFGRKATIWEFKSDNRAMYSKGERMCVNIPVQGSAADYMKLAMLRAQKALQIRGWWNNGVMVIHNLHDALILEVRNDINPVELRDLLEPAITFEVKTFPKIVADWEIGQRNGSMTAWKDEPVEFVNGVWTVVDGKPVEEDDFGDEESADEVPDFVNETGSNRISALEESPGFEVIVLLPEMPTRQQVIRFAELVKSHPGNNEIVLRTPTGDVRSNKETSLDKSSFELAMIFSGATVRHNVPVDLDALTEGLEL